MTYCSERTLLLAEAGRGIATKLLPKPFELWFSDHSTGIQMTVVLPQEGGQPIPVWKGSVWHFPSYEFNDRGDHPGLQPEFDFARNAIEQYFEDIAAAISKRKAAAEAFRQQRELTAEKSRQHAIEAARLALTAGQRDE